VLIPAYNEEKVIVRTIRSVLNSDYRNLQIIVIDDGSSDRTYEIAREAYTAEIASGRVQVLTKPNGGKAAALNYALDRLTEEIYVGIDADTVIAPDAITKLIPHFEDPLVGAVAGNAKVGNRVNLWTRWQALEYITSQNFERRALDLFNVVTVVPGAIGAWRTGPVKAAGGYPINTVAEDADLTMGLLELGLKVVYEDRALAFTGTHAPALPLVLRHIAGRLEASRRLCAQQGDGAVCAAQHSHLPNAAAAGLALHRPDVPLGHRQLLH
jgi:cellulose synthase/poly-beta-1,6-N-acetylglucosamine synthase-like glycosyltransferase